jgi:CheY-like chemotaxis protein
MPLWYKDDANLEQHAKSVADADALADGQCTEASNMRLHRRDGSVRHLRLQSHKVKGVLYTCIVDITDLCDSLHHEKETSVELATKSAALEAQKRYEHLCRAADNHILHNCKNIFVGVRDGVGMEMQPSTVKDAIVSALTHGIDVCHSREFFNLIEQELYTPVLTVVNVAHMKQLGALYGVETAVHLAEPARLDIRVVQHVLQDAFSNAKRHAGGTAIDSKVYIENKTHLCFEISNACSGACSYSQHRSNIGIQNATKCALAAGYVVSLSVLQDRAVFKLRTPYVPARTQALTVAFVDDSELNRMIATASMRKIVPAPAHLLVLGANEAEIRSFPRRAMPYAVTIVDFNLCIPGFNGETILTEMRQCGYTGPIVVRSANNTELDQQEYMAIGFDACIDKANDLKTELEHIAARYIV